MAEKTTALSCAEAQYTREAMGIDWELDNECHMIRGTYTFSSFNEALSFVNKGGEIAEAHNHHPDISLHDYNKVTVTLQTHSAGGLTHTDFDVASAIDACFPYEEV